MATSNVTAVDDAAAALRDVFGDIGWWMSRKFPASLVVLLVFIFTGKFAGSLTEFVLARSSVKPQRYSGEHYGGGEGGRPVGSEPDPRRSLAAVVSSFMRIAVACNMSMSGARMAGHVVCGLFYVIGGIFALQRAGLQLAPLLAASAAGALCVSLALKDVLGNSFAGLVLMGYDWVRPGDAVWLPGAKPGDRPAVVRQVGMTRVLLYANESPDSSGNGVLIVVPPQIFMTSTVRILRSELDGGYGGYMALSQAPVGDGMRERRLAPGALSL
jgi:hypothetical protein